MKKIVFVAVFSAFLWIPILLVVGYSFAVNMRISEQAMQLAHGRPYCIMVAKNHEHVYKGVTSTSMEYETADSFMDTMGLLMMGGKARNHAVLVVGYKENEVDYHWSYWNFGFMKGALGPFHSCANYKFDYSNLKPSDYL